MIDLQKNLKDHFDCCSVSGVLIRKKIPKGARNVKVGDVFRSISKSHGYLEGRFKVRLSNG